MSCESEDAAPQPSALSSGGSSSKSNSNSSGNESESCDNKPPRPLWNYYYEKPHLSQYIPGAKALSAPVAAANVESFTQNLKFLGRVRVYHFCFEFITFGFESLMLRSGFCVHRFQIHPRAHIQQVVVFHCNHNGHFPNVSCSDPSFRSLVNFRLFRDGSFEY
jgi:hypothetical protein